MAFSTRSRYSFKDSMARAMRSLLHGSWREKFRPLDSRTPTSTSPSGTTADRFHDLDIVELTTRSGRWPQGTPGTIVELEADHAIVEIADDRGHTVELIEVPVAFLRRLRFPHQERLGF